jgi:hypothetical protein
MLVLNTTGGTVPAINSLQLVLILSLDATTALY